MRFVCESRKDVKVSMRYYLPRSGEAVPPDCVAVRLVVSIENRAHFQQQLMGCQDLICLELENGFAGSWER
jgi:hypothetical protein